MVPPSGQLSINFCIVTVWALLDALTSIANTKKNKYPYRSRSCKVFIEDLSDRVIIVVV